MTVIAYKDGILAADSMSFTGGMKYKAMHSKIGVSECGLFGAAGLSSDVQAYRWYMAKGMKVSSQFSMDKEEPLHAIWIRPDGTAWWCNERLCFVQIEAPAAFGEAHASAFVEGAMRAGLSAPDAIALAIKHCTFIGGDVVTVSLSDCPGDAKMSTAGMEPGAWRRTT